MSICFTWGIKVGLMLRLAWHKAMLAVFCELQYSHEGFVSVHGVAQGQVSTENR